MTRLLSVLILISVASIAHAKLYRWVDEKGQVQYSDKPPVTGQTAAEMDSSGRVRKTPSETRTLSKEEQAQLAEEKRRQIEQERRDRALLQTYSKPEELDARRDLQIESVQAGITSNQLRKQTVAERLKKLQGQVETLEKRKRPVPDDLKAEIELTRKEMADIDRNIAKQQQDIEDIRKRSEADKQRWRELKQQQDKPR
ncbi:DUF4124 domain-containing protein [Chitinilyticum litopenaei]|uniref:DUF4124 domain-containing protein n=1 Tax=Chitinilyticum litopenaei TaxID=1121276 RepID=UPI00041DA246|nr:DUF4124 domain-containing protein [Chitinilyticum litopenaei]